MLIQMAWRNIWRNRIRSLVIIASVTLGLVAGIFVLGLYDGILHARLHTLIETEVSHMQLHHPSFKTDYEAGYTIPKGDSLLLSLSTLPFIRQASGRLMANGILLTSTGSSGVQIIGVVPDIENSLSQLQSKLIQGKGFETAKRNQVIIGKKLADKMKVKVGSKIVLTFTDKESTIVSAAFRIAGIYQSDNTPLDQRNVYVHLNDLGRLLGIESGYHEIAILLRENADLASAQAQLQHQHPALTIETWQELSPETKLMIETTDTYSIIFIIIIMLALMFGIINSMLMAILERTREIGMLVALGMNKLKLFLLILWETTLLTLAGVPFGFAAAWIMINYFNTHGIDISSFSGAAMSGFGFSSLIYPEFPWTKLLTVFYIVGSTALLASLFPSYKALKLVPVEAMRT